MIRKAKQAEIDEILAVTQACAAKMASENIFQWDEAYPNKEAFEKDIVRDELHVMLVDNTIMACITISTEKDTEYNTIDWLTPEGSNFYIHRLAVHPKFQRQGKARLLMDFAEDYAKQQNALSVRLDTFSRNIRNQRFYVARGYHRLGDVYFPRQTEHPFYCYELVLR